jgi:uncharacterized membrane protein
MKNRNVGFLITAISIVIVFIILIFNWGMKDVLGMTCSHGPSCTMYKTLSVQTYISLAIAGLVFFIGLFLIFAKENEKTIIKTIKEKNKKAKLNLEGLDADEKQIIKILQDENGAIFQSSLMEKLNSGKVKITRLLDKLEAKQLIERKRRGMNNIVVLRK